MKLLKKILPAVTLASAATIVATVVGSCSCGSTIKLNVCDKYTAGLSDVYYLTSEKKLNLKSKKQYTFKIDLNDYIWDGAVESAQPQGSLLLVEGEIGVGQPKTIAMSSAEVSIDQKQLNYVEKITDLVDGSYTIITEEYINCLVYSYSKLSDKSKLSITIEVDSNESDIQPLYIPAESL